MSTHRAHNAAARWIWCPQCDHRGYLTRSDAKAVRKRHRGKGLTIFTCPHRIDNDTDLFHLGHQPAALGRGRVDRGHITDGKRTSHIRRTTALSVSDTEGA